MRCCFAVLLAFRVVGCVEVLLVESCATNTVPEVSNKMNRISFFTEIEYVRLYNVNLGKKV